MTPLTPIEDMFSIFIYLITEMIGKLFDFELILIPIPYWYVWLFLVIGIITIINSLTTSNEGQKGDNSKNAK